MSKAAHTDLPWHSNAIAKGDLYKIPTYEISGMNSMFWVAQVRSVDHTDREFAQCAANAELIVTAVNHHQELLTRLYNLVNEIGIQSPVNLELTPGLILRLTEARELIKKLTP